MNLPRGDERHAGEDMSLGKTAAPISVECRRLWLEAAYVEVLRVVGVGVFAFAGGWSNAAGFVGSDGQLRQTGVELVMRHARNASRQSIGQIAVSMLRPVVPHQLACQQHSITRKVQGQTDSSNLMWLSRHTGFISSGVTTNSGDPSLLR